jgi:thiamine biosynthesis lipoprotein
MGTLNVLLLGGAPEEELQAGAQEAFDCLARLEQALSKFLPDSDLSLLNVLGATRPVAVGEDLYALLRHAREAWEITGGAFDATVGPLLDAWGLVDLDGRIPPAAEVEKLLARTGMQHVIIEEPSRKVRFAVPGVALDLGGIAKGYAVDRCRSLLGNRGIPAGALVAGRSSVALWGSPPGEDRWRVEVVHPLEPGEVYRTILVEPGVVSSSGTTTRRFFQGGREYGHLLDPRTGRQARGVRGVTTWTRSALLGDVLSTALFVLGRDALVAGGVVETLVRRWCAPGEEPRATVLLLEDNSRVWGGIDLVVQEFGRPGVTLLEE